MSIERRNQQRRSVMRHATIMLSPTHEIRCVVENVSRTGAMIVIEQELKLPARFILDMSGNVAVKRVCELVWQDGLNVGVNFAKLSNFQSIQFGLP